jgi:hypothetical protein
MKWTDEESGNNVLFRDVCCFIKPFNADDDNNKTSEFFSHSVFRSHIKCLFHLTRRQTTPQCVMVRICKCDPKLICMCQYHTAAHFVIKTGKMQVVQANAVFNGLLLISGRPHTYWKLRIGKLLVFRMVLLLYCGQFWTPVIKMPSELYHVLLISEFINSSTPHSFKNKMTPADKLQFSRKYL